MINPFFEGSAEWYAYGYGYEYAGETDGVYDAPLSGEWASTPSPVSVGTRVMKAIMGDWYTTRDYRNDMAWDDDSVDHEAIMDAYEAGYQAWRDDNGRDDD